MDDFSAELGNSQLIQRIVNFDSASMLSFPALVNTRMSGTVKRIRTWLPVPT